MKTWLIIKREYWTRVRKKTFILTTLLVPILMLGLMGLSIALTMISDDTKNIAVIDESGIFKDKVKSTKDIKYSFIDNGNVGELKKDKKYNAVIQIPKFDINKDLTLQIHSEKALGIGAMEEISDVLNTEIINQRIANAGVNIEMVNELRRNTLKLKSITNDGKENKSEIAVVIGYISGFLLYMFMFMYGFNVMRSVMEEKMNRIAEIIVSSVKPFQLMLGKIIGVALVGLTQFILWVIFGAILFSIAGLIFGPAMSGADMATQMPGGDITAINPSLQTNNYMEVMELIKNINWFTIIFWFLFYFLGGYFLYASLFAAVGSLVDEDAQDAQQLTFPITMPIILGFLMLTSTIKNPHGPIAVFGSIFPLTSPIVMMARIPYGITGSMVWQLALSAILLIGGFILTSLLAAKIYRTGILMYGKKVTLKEVGKWIFQKNV